MAKDPSKTEKATDKRRRKVRNEGNVPKAQEVTKTLTIVAGVLGLFIYFSVMIDHIRNIFVYFFANAVTFPLTDVNAHSIMALAIQELAIIVLPVICFVGLVAFISLRVQVGKLWTTKVFKFKWSNFNLAKGLQRMFFSLQTFIRLGKSIAQAAVIGIVPTMFVMNEFHNFLPLYYTNASGLGTYMLETGFKMVVYTLAPMLIIAAVDLFYTRYEYEENIKMTKQEVKDEMRQAEGDPMIKNKQKQKMFQVMASRMMQDVKKADVVITNPTHFAVALRYDASEFPAPVVVAKGVDHVAEKIKKIARENRVPIRESRLLARTLYKNVEVGQPIPEELYKAVAAILAEIWRIQGKIPTKPGA